MKSDGRQDFSGASVMKIFEIMKGFSLNGVEVLKYV